MTQIREPGRNRKETGGISTRERESLEMLLEDARWIFSGMIYGFSFTWTPRSLARGIEEELTITPLGLIPKGDPRMKVLASVEENGFLFIQLEYQPDAAQQARLKGWSGEAYPAASGSAAAALIQEAPRRRALEAAVREAIHLWLREREYNKPREVSGRVAFTHFPETGLDAGHVKASVRLRMILNPLRHYSVK